MALTGTIAKKQEEIGKRLAAVGLELLALTSNSGDRYKGSGPVRYWIAYRLPGREERHEFPIEGADRLDVFTSTPATLRYVLWYFRNRRYDSNMGGDKLRERVDRAKKDYGRALADESEQMETIRYRDGLAAMNAAIDNDPTPGVDLRYGEVLRAAVEQREALYKEIAAIVGPEPERPDLSGGFWSWVPRY